MFETAQMETRSAFGDDGMYLEKFVENARHIEFQILADSFGNVVHLGERDCSIQRPVSYTHLDVYKRQMLYGHRNDIDGYAAALTEFDQWLGEFLPLLKEGDRLVITADHGCDPSTPSTDHSREYVPLLIWGKGLKPHNLGTRRSYADLGKTIADWFAIPNRLDGTSFAEEVQ